MWCSGLFSASQLSDTKCVVNNKKLTLLNYVVFVVEAIFSHTSTFYNELPSVEAASAGIHTHTHAHTHTHTHTHTRTHTRTHACAHTHMHAHTHARTHTRMNTCMHKHTHIVCLSVCLSVCLCLVSLQTLCADVQELREGIKMVAEEMEKQPNNFILFISSTTHARTHTHHTCEVSGPTYSSMQR